jgi:dienelactone hydrolase
MKAAALFLSASLLTFAASLSPAQQKKDWPALVQKPYAKLAIPDLGLKPLLLTESGKPITTKDQWLQRRAELHKSWLERLGQPPAKPDKLDVKIHKSEQVDGYTRQLISFHSADGDRLTAYLLIPGGLKNGEKRPAVVVFHQTTKHMHDEPVGLGDNPSLAIGVHLVKRGYVVLAPQCFILKDGWAKAQAEAIARRWPGWTGMGKMTFDASRCVDFLETLAYVDASRIGCIGHSLGAKEVLYALAFEPRYQAGVFNEGGIGLRMSNWTDAWYLTDKMKAFIPKMEHHQVLALVAPRPILILGGDSADGDASWPFIDAVLPVYKLLGASDRIGLFNHKAKHTFPTEARRVAYQWLDHWLEFRPFNNEVGP